MQGLRVRQNCCVTSVVAPTTCASRNVLGNVIYEILATTIRLVPIIMVIVGIQVIVRIILMTVISKLRILIIIIIMVIVSLPAVSTGLQASVTFGRAWISAR